MNKRGGDNVGRWDRLTEQRGTKFVTQREKEKGRGREGTKRWHAAMPVCVARARPAVMKLPVRRRREALFLKRRRPLPQKIAADERPLGFLNVRHS